MLRKICVFLFFLLLTVNQSFAQNSIPKISIITVCYNEPELERTTNSIVNQNFQDFEWVVVDGGSNQETQAIWNKYKNRIDIFVSEPDSGIYNAMNKGIKLAHGEYLLFLNAGDEFYDKNSLATAIQAGYPFNEDIIYGQSLFISQSGGTFLNNLPIPMNKDYFTTNCLDHQSTFVKRELFFKYGLYNESYKSAGDLEKWIELVMAGCSFKYLPVVVSKYYLGGMSSTMIGKSESEEIRKKYFPEIEATKYLLNKKTSFNPNSAFWFIWPLFILLFSVAVLFVFYSVYISKKKNLS